MFTGIVQTKFPIADILKKEEFATLVFEFSDDLVNGLKVGASVAINGTCLTARAINGNQVMFDAIGQTLRVTNLGELAPGDMVNIERAARFGDEVGGHLLSGHIMDQVRVLELLETDNNFAVWFERPEHLAPYLLDKGYVALNGCSLTIAEVENSRFSVHLIPETREVTTFGAAKIGDLINLEVDPQTQAVVDTVKRLLSDPAMRNSFQSSDE